MSRKIVDTKQIHVVKTLLTDPSDTPKISAYKPKSESHQS